MEQVMAIGKREKIVAFGISGLVVIGLVHFMVFSSKTRAVNETRNRYQSAEGSVRAVRNTRETQLNQYNSKTDEQFKEPFKKIATEMQFKKAVAWGPWGEDRENAALTQKTYEQLLDVLDELLALRTQGAEGRGMRLSFLDSGSYSWNIPTALPQVVSSGQADLFDLLDRVRGQYATVEAAEEGLFRQNAIEQYKQALFYLEINHSYSRVQFPQLPPSYFEMYQMFGPPVPFLKMLQHSRLYFEKQPETGAMFRSLHEILVILGFNPETGLQTVLPMEDVLFPSPVPNASGTQGGVSIDITKAGWKEYTFGDKPTREFDIRDFFFYYQTQLNALIEIIRIGNKVGLREVQYVRLREAKMLPELKAIDETVAATPTPATDVMFDMDAGGMGMYADPMMADPRFAGGGRFGGGMGMGAPPPSQGEKVAVSTPIDLVVVGSNAAISQFLYDLSFTLRPVELDSVRISGAQAQAGQETLLTATISLNVIADMLTFKIPE